MFNVSEHILFARLIIYRIKHGNLIVLNNFFIGMLECKFNIIKLASLTFTTFLAVKCLTVTKSLTNE